jgi:hypothetical protein
MMLECNAYFNTAGKFIMYSFIVLTLFESVLLLPHALASRSDIRPIKVTSSWRTKCRISARARAFLYSRAFNCFVNPGIFIVITLLWL